MFVEGPHQGAVICPHFESRDPGKVVVAPPDGVYNRQAFQFDHTVSGLCRREGCAPALYQGQFIFVDLNECEAYSVEAQCIRQNDCLDVRVEGL